MSSTKTLETNQSPKIAMADTKTVQLGFRVRPEKAALLDALAASTQRPRAWLLEQALDGYLERQAWQIAHIEAGVADAEAGRVVSHDRVREWLMRWGSDDEGEPPA